MRSSQVNWLIFLALGFFWGSSYLFIKIGVETLPPFTLIAGRLGIGAVLLGLVLFFSREPLPRDPAVYRRLAVMGAINIAVPFTLITWGEQSIDSGLASVLNATVPLITIMIAPLVFADESITVNRVLGVALGFIGVVVLVSRSLGGGESSLLGEIALLGSSVSYACGAVYARRSTKGLRPMVPAFFQVFFAFLITGTMAVVLDRPWTLTPGYRRDLQRGLARRLRVIARVPVLLPPATRLGRDPDIQRRIPPAGRRDRPWRPRPRRDPRRTDRDRRDAHHRWRRAGQQQASLTAPVQSRAVGDHWLRSGRQRTERPTAAVVLSRTALRLNAQHTEAGYRRCRPRARCGLRA